MRDFDVLAGDFTIKNNKSTEPSETRTSAPTPTPTPSTPTSSAASVKTPRLTIRDIAQLAGVSQTTASRVLNGRGEVRAEVRARVEQVIAETGYRPLASAQSLVSQRSGVIGFIVPLSADTLFADPYFGVLVHGLSRAAAEKSLTVALFLYDEDSAQDPLIDLVVGPRRVDGLIVSAFHTREALIDRLAQFDVPVVTLGPNPYPDKFGSVTVDNIAGGILAGEHLSSLGREPIAMIGGAEDSLSGTERHQGFLTGLQQAGLEFDPAMFREGDYTFGSGERMMRELLPLSPRSVFVASDTMAAGALRVLHEHGVRVPEDIALVGFDDLPSAGEASLTTIRQPIAELALDALEMLLEQIAAPAEVEHRLVPVELIVRGSTDSQ